MHISEGILSWQVLAGGGALALAGTAAGLKNLEEYKMARTGMMSAAFFVASLIHIPLGPASVHLILNGLLGLLLGWAAFPAILVALLLQAVLFQYGGITTLGVNTVIMAGPAVMCYYLYRLGHGLVPSGRYSWRFVTAGVCGALAILGSALLAAAALFFTEEKFFEIAVLIVGAHGPVMVVEGLIAGFALTFFQKVKPALLS